MGMRPALEAMLLDRDPSSRRHVLVGASMGTGAMQTATEVGVVQKPLLVTAGGFRELVSGETMVDKTPMVPDGLKHRILPVERWEALANLARMLRADLREWEQAGGFQAGLPRPRAVIFAGTNQDA